MKGVEKCKFSYRIWSSNFWGGPTRLMTCTYAPNHY